MVRGKTFMGLIQIISVMKACKFLKRGCELLLAHTAEITRKTVDLADVEVVGILAIFSLISFLVYHHHGR